MNAVIALLVFLVLIAAGLAPVFLLFDYLKSPSHQETSKSFLENFKFGK